MHPEVPQSDLYAGFRREHLPPPQRLREPADFYDPIPVSERLVQAIWADRRFLATHLRTRNGMPMEVLQPGQWNGEGGPDFLRGKILLGGHSCQGDIEIHLHTSGWHEHRHASNPAYNNVILDVCLWDDGHERPLLTPSGRTIPQLVLHPHLEAPLDELAESIDAEDYPFAAWRPGRADSPLSRLSPEELDRYILSAALYRFERKASLLEKLRQEHGEDAAAYISLAGALGYKHNKSAFCQIAAKVPLEHLRTLSGPEEKTEVLLKVSRTSPLRLHPVRPANHPHRRLAALARIVNLHPHPADWFHQLVLDPKSLRLPPRLDDPFWSWHLHREGRPLKHPLVLLGAGRWREIVTNVILPFVHARSVLRGIQNLWLRWPAAPSNRAARQMAYDLGLGSPKNNGIQQGLIQMYQDFDLLPSLPNPVTG